MVNDPQRAIRCHHELLHSLIEGVMQLEKEVLIRNRTIRLLGVEIATANITSAIYRNLRQTLQSFRFFVFNTVVFDNIDDLWKIWPNIIAYIEKLSQIICATPMSQNVFHSLLVLKPHLTANLSTMCWFFKHHKHLTIKRPEYEIRVSISEMFIFEDYQLTF